MNDVMRNSERAQLTLKLWMSPRAEGPMSSDMALAELNPRSAFEIANMIARSSVGNSQTGRASKGAAQSVRPRRGEMMRGGPGSKMAEIVNLEDSLGQSQRFEAMGNRAGVTRRRDLIHISVESGIRCWGNFRTVGLRAGVGN